jgi:magnesium-transporting ATPase (P-type)
MIERTLVAAVVMAAVGLAAFWWMISAGWSHESARNALLLLLVLFENVHIGNCRSETRSALTVSPLRSPFLLGGAICAFLVHVAAMHTPFLQEILRTQPVNWQTWVTMIGLALTIFVAMEIHKWTWRLRHAEE